MQFISKKNLNKLQLKLQRTLKYYKMMSNYAIIGVLNDALEHEPILRAKSLIVSSFEGLSLASIAKCLNLHLAWDWLLNSLI